MSHSSSRRRVLDTARPLAHRASHARSCANHVANRLGITRKELLTNIEKNSGSSLVSPLTEEELMKAFRYMENLLPLTLARG
ncbi:MAG: hypothetical protein E7B59_11165 [Enterobacteriaceae bacterium]|nr:hypothetical protein [Enterobacteriaceae bacterium]